MMVVMTKQCYWSFSFAGYNDTSPTLLPALQPLFVSFQVRSWKLLHTKSHCNGMQRHGAKKSALMGWWANNIHQWEFVTQDPCSIDLSVLQSHQAPSPILVIDLSELLFHQAPSPILSGWGQWVRGRPLEQRIEKAGSVRKKLPLRS